MGPGKILLVANTDWYLYNFRLSLARFLRGQGYEVVLVSPPGPYRDEMAKEGFRCLNWQVGRRTMSPASEVSAISSIIKIYRSEKPLLVHHFTVKPVLYGSLAARIAGVPQVVNSVTGLGYIFINKGWKGRFLRSVVLPFYRVAFAHRRLRVIFENATDQETFTGFHLVTPENSTIIQGVGVDVQHFFPAPEPDNCVPLIVFPARMLIDKGLDTLVEAARMLRGRPDGGAGVRQSPARVALVGDPDPGNPATVDAATLRGWEQEGIVEWWGFRRDMRSIYQNCHIVTLPSLGEGLPTVLLEAAACGRPIVTTDVPGCREAVKHEVNGLLVPPGDAAALARAFERLLADSGLRARLGAAGRQLVLEQFTDQQINRATLAVYQQVLSG